MQTAIVNFQAPASTGSQVITGVGFTPKLLLALGHGSVLGTDQANSPWIIGAADGTNQVSGSTMDLDAQAASSNNSARSSTAFVNYRSATGTLQQAAALTSLDSDGFTLNWTTVNATQRQYLVLCIGGSDVQAQVGFLQAGGATGNRSITGMSFQPNTLIFFDTRLSSTQVGSGAYIRPMMGVVDSAGNQGAWAYDSHDGQAAAVITSAQSTSACIINSATAASDIDRRATFVSYDADGFTVNFSTLDAAIALNSYVMYVALNVPYSLAGSVAQRTSTGTTAVTTTGFTPKAIVLGGNATTATNAAQQGGRFQVGMAASVASQMYHSQMSVDAADPTDVSSAMNTGKILRWITASGATPSTLVEADVSAIADGSFTLNYTTVDATARQVLYLAMGDVPAATRIPRMGFINFQGPGVA
jgi:hypothetical protein